MAEGQKRQAHTMTQVSGQVLKCELAQTVCKEQTSAEVEMDTDSE